MLEAQEIMITKFHHAEFTSFFTYPKDKSRKLSKHQESVSLKVDGVLSIL